MVKIAIRSLLRQRTFTGVAVLTLALGIGATTAIFSVVYGVLLQPLPYEASDRLVHFGQTARSAPTEPVSGSSSHVNFLDWQRSSKTIQTMALYTGPRVVISTQGEADVVRAGSVTPEFFDVFKVTPVLGRTLTAEEDRPTGPRAIVISHAFWQERLGGRADVLSQSVEISGVTWPIVGVAPRGFDFPSGARLWMPVRANDEQCGRGCVYLNGIGRLADGATAQTAQQEMAGIAAALERDFPDDNYDVTVMVQTLHDRTVGSVRLALAVVLAAVLMVLLIACANVANLMLVRGASRRHEMAVRTALGAGQGRILSSLLAESLTLAVAGGALGLVLTVWGIDALKAVAPDNLPRLDNVRFDLPALAFAAAMVGLTTVLFGLGPALTVSRVTLSPDLGQRTTVGAAQARWTRSALLVGEVGLSLVLLLSAGLLLRSLASLQKTELGFDTRGLSVFTVALPPARYPVDQVIPTFDRMDEQLGALPGVSQVARISGLPLGPSENVRSFTRTDQPPPPPGQAPLALYRIVDEDYFSTMQIRVLSGRGFLPSDREGSPPVVVVSRRLADAYWPGEDPIGRQIRFGSDPLTVTVAGVVANVRSQRLTEQSQPELYVAHAQSAARGRSVMYVIKAVQPSTEVISGARRVVQAIDPRLPLIGPGAMSALVDGQLARPRFYLMLVGLFATLAVVLAAVGIYGVVAYVVTQRTREIGLRMALGARRIDVVKLMLWQGMRPAAFGVALGLGTALAASRLIQGLLYEVHPNDPLTIAGVTAILLAVVLVACAIPARRASTVAPAEALRGE